MKLLTNLVTSASESENMSCQVDSAMNSLLHSWQLQNLQEEFFLFSVYDELYFSNIDCRIMFYRVLNESYCYIFLFRVLFLATFKLTPHTPCPTASNERGDDEPF